MPGLLPRQIFLFQRTVTTLLHIRQAITLAASAAHQQAVAQYHGTPEWIIFTVREHFLKKEGMAQRFNRRLAKQLLHLSEIPVDQITGITPDKFAVDLSRRF